MIKIKIKAKINENHTKNKNIDKLLNFNNNRQIIWKYSLLIFDTNEIQICKELFEGLIIELRLTYQAKFIKLTIENINFLMILDKLAKLF